MTPEEMHQMEHEACPGCGSCAGIFTANTMNCMTEVLGMGLPGNGTIPAAYFGARRMLAKKAGAVVMELVKKNICPRDIMTMESFENAIAVDMAIGGSTNTVLHLPAIAHEAGLDLPLQKFDEISRKAAYICKMSPGGTYHMQDLNEAGGISAVMKELTKLGIIHTEAKTVTGTIGERIDQADIERPDVIHSVDNAYMNRGGIAILSGNLAPDGAVIKESAVEPDLLVYQAQPSATTRKKKPSKRLSAAALKKVTSWLSATKAEGRPGDAGNAQSDGSYYGHGPEGDPDYGRPVQRSQPGRVHRAHFSGSDGRGTHRAH